MNKATHEETVDVWGVQLEHDENMFWSRDEKLILDHVKERVADWQCSPIGNGETLKVEFKYKEISTAKLHEWQDMGLI